MYFTVIPPKDGSQSQRDSKRSSDARFLLVSFLTENKYLQFTTIEIEMFVNLYFMMHDGN